MKNNTTDKSNLRSAKTKVALTLASIFVVCVVCLGVFCVADVALLDEGNGSLTAYAADVSTGSAFINAINSNTAINLTESITVSGNCSQAEYNKEINGNGYTITIEGSGTYSLGTETAQTDQYAGLLIGKFISGTMRNVTINYTGTYAIQARNKNNPNHDQPKANPASNANSTTLYAGIICGEARNATFQNVTLIVNGTFITAGIDATSDYGSGNGGVGGGFAGRSGGATFDSCVLDLNGVIHSCGQNLTAGKQIKTGGTSSNPVYESNNCGNNTTPSRAVAGGFVGEIYSGNTIFNGVTVKGSGAVGAYVAGNTESGIQEYALRANFAGLLVGFVYASGTAYSVQSLYYDFRGAVYVNMRTLSGALPAGLIVGEASNSVLNIDNVWRDAVNADIAQSGVSAYAVTETSGKLTGSVSSIKSKIVTSLSSAGSIKNLSVGVGSVSAVNSYNNLHEFQPYLTYSQTTSSTYGTFSIDGFNSSNMTVTANSNEPYYISAQQYVYSGEHFDNVYDEYLNKHTFSTANPQSTIFNIYVATTAYEMSTNYSPETATQEYSAVAVTFSGTPAAGISIPSNMKWVAVNDKDASKSNYSAAFGTDTVGIGPSAGSYSVKLYKQGENDTLEPVKTGEFLGTNSVNAPSKIYLYDASKFTYSYTITPIEITITQVPGSSITKEYDGTATIDATMIDGSNFTAVRKDNGGKLPDAPTILVGSGSYFAEYSGAGYVESSSVGSNKYAIVKNVSVPANGNYILAGDASAEYIFTGCEITPRTMGLNWSSLELEYNGESQHPTATPANLLPGDEEMSIDITYTVSYVDTGSNAESVNVGSYRVTAKVSSDSGNSNYTLPYDLNVTSRDFTIVPKEIGVVWSGFNLTYNTNEQEVGYEFVSGAVESVDIDKLSLTVAYYDAADGSRYNKLHEAGTYYAIAELSGEGSSNYALDATSRSGDIVVEPMTVELTYYTGLNGSTVNDLVYMGADYAGHDDGLHVKVKTTASGLTSDNLRLTFPAGVEVKKVGDYKATVTLVNSSVNPINISNYKIAAGNDTYTVTVVKKPLEISFSSNHFTYTGYAQSPTYEVLTALYAGDSAPITRQLYRVDDDGEVKVTNAVNVGRYKLELTIAECDYSISTGGEVCSFEIAALNISMTTSVKIDAIPSCEYSAKPNEPVPVVRFNDSILNEGSDYSVSYADNIEVGTLAQVKITGKGNFTGELKQNFTITKKTLGLNILSDNLYIYNGEAHAIEAELTGHFEAQAPALKVAYYRNNILTNPVTVGTYTAVFEFAEPQNNYSLPSNTSFVFDIAKANVSVSIVYADENDDLVYDAQPHLVSVKWAEGIRIPAIDSDPDALDFQINYYDSRGTVIAGGPVDVGNYSVAVTLKGTARDNYNLAAVTWNYAVKAREVRISYDEALNNSFVYTSAQQSAIYGYTDEAADVIEGYEPRLSVTYTKGGIEVVPVAAGLYTVQISALNTNYKAVTGSGSGQTPGGQMVILPAELRPQITASSKIYNGVTLTATYSYVEGYGMRGQDNISLNISYYLKGEDGEETSVAACTNAGSYVARLSLPDTNSNYYFNEEKSVLECDIEISKREIAYQFTNAGERTYDGSNLVVEAGLTGNNGNITGVDFSGIIAGDSNYKFEVTMYDADLNEVEYIHDVGVYSAEISFISTNYRLTERDGYSTVTTVTILKRNVTFTPKDIRKMFGTKDNESEFFQTLTSAELGVEGDEVRVQLKREAGENYGTYRYVEIIVPEDSNYDITAVGSGAFYIDKRSLTITPNTFTMEYLDTMPELKQKEVIHTDAVGDVELTITFTRLTTETGVGTYDLSPVFEVDGEYASGFAVTLITDGNKGKFVITGRSVIVTLDESMLSVVYDPNRKIDPDFIDAIMSVEVDKCADDIKSAYEAYCDEHGTAKGFPWENYIGITRSDSKNFGYKEGGYTVTINFLKNGMIDNNYRAITPSGGNYVFMIEKLNLSGKLTEPEIVNLKNYDGTTTAVIANNADSMGIPSEYFNQGVRAYANFSDKDAGTGKTITVSYAFSYSMYENNYILPDSFEYSQKGEIKPLELNTEIVLASPEIVYGNVPEITVSLSGFISGENAETEKIKLDTVYEDGTAIDVIRDVSANYRIVLQLSSYSGTNYTVNYSSVSCNVRITPKAISVVAGAPYEKPVDGTLEAVGFGADNYVIVGLFEGDIGDVNILYSAILTSSEPGSADVNVRIEGLSGKKASNYTLSDNVFTVPATILKLADVTMSDVSYPYDTEAKPVTPVLADVLEGVTYTVEYSGRGGTVYEASENAPVNAGEYLVRCYLKLNDYERYAAECYLTIEKITPTIYFDGVFTQTYGVFTPITATATAAGLNESIAVEYSFVEPGAAMPRFAPAGNHIVSARFDSTVNYYAASREVELVIKQKSVTVSFSGYTGLVYNGLDRSLTDEIQVTFNGVVEGDVCEPVKTFSPETVKNAGTYFLEVRPGNPNYKTTGSISITFTIAKKTLVVSATANDVVAGTQPTFNITYEGFIENDDESDLTVAPTVNMTAGQVGANRIEFNNGIDENYSFVYKESTYNITYTPKQEQSEERTITVTTIVILSVVGAIAVIILLGFLVKTLTYRSMYNVSSVKRNVRERMRQAEKADNSSSRKRK